MELWQRVIRAAVGAREGWESYGGLSEPLARFRGHMDIARRIADQEPAALAHFARMLGRRVQYDLMCAVYEVEWARPAAPQDVLFRPWLPLTPDDRSLDDLAVPVEPDATVNLATDVVLPWPWSAERLADSLSNIGPGGKWGAWREVEWNHRVEVWLPFGIGWVIGGNHSIAAGIVQGVGTIKPRRVLDVSAAFEHVWCDGEHFIRRHDGALLARVTNPELAAIFEIGRLLPSAQSNSSGHASAWRCAA